MKNLIFSISILLGQYCIGQSIVETRTADLLPGDYIMQGTAYLELYDDNSLKLRFGSDYITQSNVFDVHVYLTNDNNYNAPIDTTGLLLVENIGTISGINYSSGAMTFDLPPQSAIDREGKAKGETR